ncbi:phosphate-starvation-inducible PsiE family protein [Halobaculum sp. CBA1158]|uniref:phosphate-starvation-inducible PsiE family protein n=1 Tax=Halobaculum sp. CBA1158 TaxID=2904243 RepID=UPI001F3CCE82|nr:phosphate-starvation-inducible PsiE family protein [Halobaculum sp. CBA1158]UIP00701.1 phosphate-starvation-inducible PsiE family protein [Halobaculum sp. CBA1158]
MRIDDAVEPSEQGMKLLEVGTAYFLLVLFAIGFLDLLLVLAELLASGEFTDPNQVIDIIDTVLVLLIIVEIHQTVVAFSRDEPVVRIVIAAALIAITRKVISYRPGEYANIEAAFVAAAAFSLLLAVLIGAYYVVRRTNTDAMTSGPFGEGGTGTGTSGDGDSPGSGSTADPPAADPTSDPESYDAGGRDRAGDG